jgi:hypothetical protein
MKNLVRYLLGFALFSQSVFAQTTNARLDINQGMVDGTISAEYTTLDIGRISDVFDNNFGTLARSANINPMVITLSFTSPVTLTSSIINMASDGDWTMEIASNLTDLNAKTNSYVKLFNQSQVVANVSSTQVFANASAKVVRLTATRVGDNYVHLYEWQLFANQTVTSLSIVQAPHFVFKSNKLVISPAQQQKLKVNGLTSGGASVEITNATFSSANTSIATVSSSGTVTGVALGTTTITASLGSVSTPLTVSVVNDVNGADFCVQYIKRRPQIDYVVNSTNPSVQGWPVVNSNVTWRAYVKSWFPAAKNNVSYKWLINGTQVASGTVNIPARGVAKIDYIRPWTFTREELTFVIDANSAVTEVVETNNQLKTYTNAISLNYYVEQSIYEYFHRYQRSVAATEKTNSFEDWLQIRHIKRWNEVMFASAIYPETPNGVLDRIRLDSLVIIPDNALPLTQGSGANDPNANDLSVDLKWMLKTAQIGTDFVSETNGYRDTLSANDGNSFYFEGSLLHEIGHARYLVDEYAYDCHDNDPGVVEILENGVRIAGDNNYMPHIPGGIVLYYSQQHGLMNGTYTYVDRHSAAALNLIAGHRAVNGNTNPPGNIGIFLNDLAAQNRFTVKDAQGNLLRNASIKIYQTVSSNLPKQFDNVADLVLSTDANGQVLVGNNPFQADGNISNPNEGLIIVRVETATQIGYTFFESSWFNLAYWRGQTTLADLDLVFDKLVTKTAIGISGPACVVSGQSNTYTVNPEFGNYSSMYWWIDGDGYVTQNTYNPKVALVTFSQYNTTGKVHVGITYANSPWYVAYEKTVRVNNCSSARAEDGDYATSTVLEPTKIRVVNLQGMEVAKGEASNASTFFHEQSLPAGLYLVQVDSPTGAYVMKLVK